jgi:hypothetical protein
MTDVAPPVRPFRIFDVDDRYRRMAVRRGGPSRDQALRQAEEQVAQQTPQFDAWLDQDIEGLAEIVTRLAAGAAEEGWAAAASERAVSIRDIARTLRLEVLASIAGALAAVIEPADTARETRPEALQRHVEAIRLARRRTQLGLPSDRLNEVDDSLRRVIEKARSG